jgi:hypothetical protein
MVETVVRHVDFGAQEVLVSYAGGLMLSEYYRRHVFSAITRQVAGAVLHHPELPPVVGAALLALQSARIPITEDVIRLLKRDSAMLREGPGQC